MPKKDFDGDPGALIGDTIFSVIKPLYKEGEKAKRARRPPRRTYYYAPEPKVSQKEIVFGVLRRAIQNAGANFSRRDLYYATRPLAYAHPDWEEDKELKYGYFSQGLLTEYQEMYGLIQGLWSDPRGHLHEPHPVPCEVCGVAPRGVLALGTREVLTYRFPEHTFDKILYVEKEGEWSKLKAARLAERYDMGVASAKGYPVEAVRELFARAEQGAYQLFVFHDADPHGYNIAHVMREATKRMPYHKVEVVDIGLTVADAVDMDLDFEPYSTTKAMPGRVSSRLTDLEREYFGEYGGERVELNAILPDTRRIKHIERKLKQNDVRDKVIPSDEALAELADKQYREKSAQWVSGLIDELLSTDELKKAIADEFIEKFELGEAHEHIADRLKKGRSLSWRKALEKHLVAVKKSHAAELKAAVEKRLRQRIKSGAAEGTTEDEGPGD